MADTDVLIDFLSGHEPVATLVASALSAGEGLATTVVSRFELLAGARSAKQERAVRRLLGSLSTLELDSQAADRAALVRRDLEKAGASIGMANSLIAGIVLERAGRLLTRNRRLRTRRGLASRAARLIGWTGASRYASTGPFRWDVPSS